MTASSSISAFPVKNALLGRLRSIEDHLSLFPEPEDVKDPSLQAYQNPGVQMYLETTQRLERHAIRCVVWYGKTPDEIGAWYRRSQRFDLKAGIHSSCYRVRYKFGCDQATSKIHARHLLPSQYDLNAGKCLILTHTIGAVNTIEFHINAKLNLRCEKLHGKMTRAHREQVMHSFKHGHVSILVATMNLCGPGVNVDGM